MLRKTRPLVGFKSLIAEGPGVFEAIVSVFGNVDYAGDRVIPGAFAGSLSRWADSGDPIPVIFAHQWDNLDAHVGEVLEAKELLPGDELLEGTGLEANGGLWVKARLDVEEDFAGRLWKRLEARRIKEFSFAYDVLDERKTTDGVTELVELDVFEVGPCLKGMNPATELLLAKSLAERFLEAKTDDPAELEKIIRAELGKAADNGVPSPAKAYVTLAGSVEERQQAIYSAGLDALPLDEANGGFYALYLEATFDDRAVFLLEGWNDPVGEGRFFEADVVDGDDGLELENVREVVVEGVTRPKARAKELRSTKAARPGATVADDGHLEGKLEGKAEDLPGGKAEDPKARTGSESGATGEASRLLVELDDLELTS